MVVSEPILLMLLIVVAVRPEIWVEVSSPTCVVVRLPRAVVGESELICVAVSSVMTVELNA